MKTRIKPSLKLMGATVAISLGWILLTGDDCDPLGCNETKEQKFPGFWIACINDAPTLMTYNGDNPTIVSTTPAGTFNPSDWDCSHPNSPPYKGSETTPPFQVSSPEGPAPGRAIRPKANAAPVSAFIPRQVLDLPFVPKYPAPTTCDPSWPDVFQTIHTNAEVTRISTCPFQIKATIPVQTRPLQVKVTPDGSTLLVTSFDNAVTFINLKTNQVTYTLNTDPDVNPHGLAISPDGSTAYITSFNPDNSVVQVIDIASRKVTATIPTITYPQGATLTPDGSQLWITSPYASVVDIIDTLTNTDVTQLDISDTTDVAFNSRGTVVHHQLRQFARAGLCGRHGQLEGAQGLPGRLRTDRYRDVLRRRISGGEQQRRVHGFHHRSDQEHRGERDGRSEPERDRICPLASSRGA